MMRYLTASRWLFSAASISGVRWSSEQLSMLAPAWGNKGIEVCVELLPQPPPAKGDD